jgi:hypothetical protein
VRLPRDEQRLEVGDRAAAGEVSEVGVEPEHVGERGHGLAFHPRGGGAAVLGVVVRVDQHRRQVARDRHGMRRLEHLAGIVGVEERVVVREPLGQLGERRPEPVGVDLLAWVRLVVGEATLPGRDRVHTLAQPRGEIGHALTIARAPQTRRRTPPAPRRPSSVL